MSVQEAKHRFALQDAAGNLNAQLIAKESATFAGLWLEHSPQFKVVVQFAGANKPNIASYTQNKELAVLVEIRTAKLSLVELEKAQMQAFSSVANHSVRIESGLNVQKNHVELYVLAQDIPNIAAKMTASQMPEFVDLITVPALSQPQALPQWYGGLAIRGQNGDCTTGFAVRRNSDGARGVLTAGHCHNTQVATFTGQGQFLTFLGEKYGGPYEFQWHRLAGYTPVNNIQWSASGATRYITGAKARNYQVIGAYVCKYGLTTKYGCGNIADKNYLLDYLDPWKPQIPFTATFIRVSSNTNPFTKPGDSGGPWYNGYTAYGVHSTGFGYNAVYMAIDYISALDLSVLNVPYRAPTPIP